MVVGFLGKGGSGKSTLASLYAAHLHAAGNAVLAVDADHNMDMTFNLAGRELPTYIGQGIKDLMAYTGTEGGYRNVFLGAIPRIALTDMDPITAAYSHEVRPGMRLMSTGPHTAQILNDQACSHSLTTPLKVYLPFLQLGDREHAVVDEKAGSDGVGTGVTTGFDLAVVVAEPTVHGTKAAHQIADLLEFYGTPYVFVLNKVRDEADAANGAAMLGTEPLATFGYSADRIAFDGDAPAAYADGLRAIATAAAAQPNTRLQRTLTKLATARAFTEGA